MLPGKGELQCWVIARVQNTCSLVPGLPGAVTAAIRRFRAPSPDISEAEQFGQVQGSQGEQNPALTLLSFTHLQLDQKVTTEH